MNNFIEMTSIPNSDSWEIKTDGEFKGIISDTLQNDDIPEDAINDIFDNAAQILGKCPNPRINVASGKTGILIGKVQSGKTSNFISLIALAFDNDYKIAIVLGGNKKNLLQQNATRIKNAFGINDPDKLVVLTTNTNAALLSAERIKQFIDRGSKVIIVALKHQMHINLTSDIFNHQSVNSIPTLILDDEGDQATLNTKYNSQDMSTIYRSVLDLKSHLTKHCFISITATPQANILIDQFDLLSPDFGELIYPGQGYCGLNEFHGEDEDKYIKVIPPAEPNILDATGMPQTFYKALACFFVGGALRQYRGDDKTHSMLIHPSQKKYDHNIVIEKAKLILDKWRGIADKKLVGINDISYAPLDRELRSAYDGFVKDGVILPEYDALEKNILKSIKECSPVHLCNSTDDTSEDAQYFKFNIFVGGNMLERGITIKGLAVTFITRRAQGVSNVDNTEQRARWFGYKRSYLDVCRVFTTADIKRDFANIFEHEEDLWSSIERAQQRGTPFKEIPRIFKLNSSFLRLTRINVARTKRLSFTEWTRQSHFLFDEDKSHLNNSLLEQLFDKYKNQQDILPFYGANKHCRIKDLNAKEIFTLFRDEYAYPTGCKLNSTFFEKLEEGLQCCDISPTIDVLWVRHQVGEIRKIYDDGCINQMFQGHSPNRLPGTPEYYPGDSNMIDGRENAIQIQIHFIKPRNDIRADYYSPAVAVYIPNTYASELSRLITQG